MKRMRSKTLLPALSTILLAGGALAEDNLTKLGQFKTTGVTEFTTIAQDAPAANSIRNILRAIELPPGFTIDLYALVPDARHMAMAPQGTALSWAQRKKKSGS
jgi:ABC-type oligopeptide transport system substrate-binding subunit